VITRAREAGGAFAAGLRALGAQVTEFPTIEIVAPDSYMAIDAALARTTSFDWVIFTSATGVERMLERMKTRGVDPLALGGAKLGAIGPATAARLAERALTVAAMPREYRAEAIVEALDAERIRGARILIPRAQVAREVLPEMLIAAGAREVVVAPVYKTVKPANAPVERVRELAAAGAIDLVAFTSSSTVTNFCEMIGASVARGLRAAAIGPITAETARASGLQVVVQPTEYTVPALIAAIRDYFVVNDK
ncbi:MAG: uroporphyrinogen-III synthase, partial [Candidatus Binataceae bacterium]